MNEFKRFITCALGAVALILTIAASSGAINYGVQPDIPSFYIFAGVCNLLGWGGLTVYKGYRFLKETRDGNPSAGAGAGTASPEHTDNKTDEQKRP